VRQAFVVCPARSGSTLLRYLLNAHADVVSPPELNLSTLLQHLVEAWSHTDVAMGVAPAVDGPGRVAPTEEAYRRARKTVDQIMVTCANAVGASLYCDKSLTTVDHLDTVARCYPRAPLIFLYRYPLDMIASGLEASRWGFNAFGFVPFVTATPGNFIAGLANYWIDRVSKMLQFERSFAGPSARIYYELLCDDPTATLENLFEFLGVIPDRTVIERAFASDHGRGPGDYKIDFTGAISVRSIGRGSALPEHMSPDQVLRINELLAELDYPDLEAAWRGDLAALVGLKNIRRAGADGAEIARSVADLLSTPARGELVDAHQTVFPLELAIARAGEPGRVLIESATRATVLNGAASTGEPGRPRIRCSGDILLRVAAGDTTFGDAVRDGEIRVEWDREEERPEERRPSELLAALAALIRAHV
jgi:Sulfotransferase family